MLGLCCLLCIGAVAAQGTSKDFWPGWNGLAQTPPMGWRSWNAFGNRITQKMMTDAVDVVVAKKWTVGGTANVSLLDVGYSSVGTDEGWEGCGQGVNGTQHDAAGFPVVNSKFPDLKTMVDYGHGKGLKMGWYLNGCACGEHHELSKNYQGDVERLHSFGFDAVKIDGCGAQVNMTYYAELMKATGAKYAIENCHWGHCGAFKGNVDGSSCPTLDWCPFNWYRTSGDINSGSTSWLKNLQTTRKFQGDQPLSRPGCWAYPDMLEVGRVKGTLAWNRAHFGAWCIVSAPLILGLDLTNPELLEPVIPIITNKEAIAVNQQWFGHPGRLILELADGAIQIWAKPQPDKAIIPRADAGKSVAVLVINSGAVGFTASIALSKLGAASTSMIRDIWAQKDAGVASGNLTTDLIPAQDSRFYLLRPQVSALTTEYV